MPAIGLTVTVLSSSLTNISGDDKTPLTLKGSDIKLDKIFINNCILNAYSYDGIDLIIHELPSENFSIKIIVNSIKQILKEIF